MSSTKWPVLDKKKWIIIAVFLAVVIVLYFVFFYKTKKVQPNALKVDEPNENLSQDSTKFATEIEEPLGFVSAEQNDSFPLKMGKYGKRVEQAQAWFVSKYGANFTKGVNGVWAEEMEAIVNKFLKKDNISEAYFDKIGMGKFITTKFN